MRKAKVLRKITKEQIINLMNDRRPGLKMEYDALKHDYEIGELSHGFRYGNFYSLYDEVKDKIIPGKVVISWVNNKYDGCEMIVDSLEELVYYLSEINSSGNIDVDNSEVEIEVDEGAFADELEEDDYEELEESQDKELPIYRKDFRIEDLTREPGNPHLIIKARVAKSSEDGWRTDWVKQEVAIPLETVYEILDTLGVNFSTSTMVDLLTNK